MKELGKVMKIDVYITSKTIFPENKKLFHEVEVSFLKKITSEFF